MMLSYQYCIFQNQIVSLHMIRPYTCISWLNFVYSERVYTNQLFDILTCTVVEF